jgi:hypothetical protein
MSQVASLVPPAGIWRIPMSWFTQARCINVTMHMYVHISLVRGLVKDLQGSVHHNQVMHFGNINEDIFLPFFLGHYSPNPDGYKKCVAVQLGVIYDSQVTNRKQARLPVRAPSSPCTPFGRLGVIYDLQRDRVHKNTITKRWNLLLFWLNNRLRQNFCNKNLYQHIILTHLMRNRSRIKSIFYFMPFWAVSVQSFGSHIHPQPSGSGLIFYGLAAGFATIYFQESILGLTT